MEDEILGLRENLQNLLNEGTEPKINSLVNAFIKNVPEAKEYEKEVRKIAKELLQNPKTVQITTSFYDNDDIIAEEILNDGEPKFIIWNKGKESIEILDNINKEIFPNTFTSEEEKEAVLLPKGIQEFGTIDDLVKSIQDHIHKYCDVSEDFEVWSAYYILLSWVYDKLTTLPYLRVLGDTGTGKSRFLDVVGRLCYKACIVAGSITPAPIYRMIRKWKGSIIIDEADFKDSTTYNEVIKILNCGFEKGKPVIRSNKDDPNNIEFLPTFAPKIIASRYSFHDKALESRCLTESMKETSRKDIPRIIPEGFYVKEEELRQKLLMFRFKWRNKLEVNKIQEINLGDIEPRLEQASLSFAVLFANIPEMMEKFKQFLLKYNQELIEERANSFEGRIVNAIFTLKELEKEHISATDIIQHIDPDDKEKIRPQKIGKSLKSLGIKTRQVRVGSDVRRPIIWDENLMYSLKRKYVALYDTNATNDTHATKS